MYTFFHLYSCKFHFTIYTIDYFLFIGYWTLQVQSNEEANLLLEPNGEFTESDDDMLL